MSVKQQLIEDIEQLVVPPEHSERQQRIADFIRTRHIPDNDVHAALSNQYLQFVAEQLEADFDKTFTHRQK
jgi:hypothetical protein